MRIDPAAKWAWNRHHPLRVTRTGDRLVGGRSSTIGALPQNILSMAFFLRNVSFPQLPVNQQYEAIHIIAGMPVARSTVSPGYSISDALANRRFGMIA